MLFRSRRDQKKSIFDSYTLCLSLFILNVYPYFYLFTGEKAFEYRVDNNNKYIIIIHKIWKYHSYQTYERPAYHRRVSLSEVYSWCT